MKKQHLILTLAKVLLAAAWADGEMSHEEINSMKDLLFRLPQLSARQWASLQMYMEAPVGDAERARLVDELRRRAAQLHRRVDLALEAVARVLRDPVAPRHEQRGRGHRPRRPEMVDLERDLLCGGGDCDCSERGSQQGADERHGFLQVAGAGTCARPVVTTARVV